MFQLQTEHTTYQHSWRLVAALVTVILAAILVARVFPMRRFPQIASLPPISDARAWGAYPRLNYRLPTLSGNRFIPTSLSSDGEQLGGYALTPDGHGAIISIFSLETMANQRIGVYHLSQPAKLPAIWVGDNYALIISPDHKLVTCYNVLTHTLTDHSDDQATILDANLNNVSDAVDGQGIIPEEITTPDGHTGLQFLNAFDGTHTFIASDIMAPLGFIETYLVYGQDNGNVATLYEVSTRQRIVLPTSIAQVLYAPTNTFVTMESAAFIVKTPPDSPTEDLYEIDKMSASTEPAILPIATSLARGTHLVAANDRLVLLNYHGRYFAWDLTLNRLVTFPDTYRMAGIAGNWLWMASNTQLTVVNTDGLPGR